MKTRLIIVSLIFTGMILASHLVAAQKTHQGWQQALELAIQAGEKARQEAWVFPATTHAIRHYEGRVALRPRDTGSLIELGRLYLRHARETDDVTFYQNAESTLQRAYALAPRYYPANVALAQALNAQHRFGEALEIAQHAQELLPGRMEARLARGDALLELGETGQAVAAFASLSQEMKGGASLLARQAHVAELHGEPQRAIRLLEQAISTFQMTSPSSRDVNWFLLRLGELYFDSGQLTQAQAFYQAALDLNESDAFALAGLAAVQAAHGRYASAIGTYHQSLEIFPEPLFMAALGDLYLLTGQPEQAQEQFDALTAILKEDEYAGGIHKRELALFYADHDLHLDEALNLVQSEFHVRQDIYTFDAAGWVYYKNGLLEQAGEMVKQALRLGTRDAHLYYHAGMIALAQGNAQQGREYLSTALAINPYFDPLQAAQARQALRQARGW